MLGVSRPFPSLFPCLVLVGPLQIRYELLSLPYQAMVAMLAETVGIIGLSSFNISNNSTKSFIHSGSEIFSSTLLVEMKRSHNATKRHNSHEVKFHSSHGQKLTRCYTDHVVIVAIGDPDINHP
jgi:hypothetical protein